jgi:hypothetical protein
MSPFPTPLVPPDGVFFEDCVLSSLPDDFFRTEQMTHVPIVSSYQLLAGEPDARF